jgi:steroid 5-alpha reductase family enzyme
MQLTSYRRFRISTVDHGYSLQNAQVYILQGAFLFLIALPVLMINRGPGGAFGFLEVTGVCVWLFGFLFESVGDAELARSQEIRTIGARYCKAGCGGTRDTPTISERSCNSGHLAGGGRRSGRLL